MSSTPDDTNPGRTPHPDRNSDEEIYEYLMQVYDGEPVGRIAEIWYEYETQDSQEEANSS